ncbi:hypothetical protein [Paraburkholderia terricola]|uniref:Uncharacterized protein n=1 Tax=Paraburkholderia terricola TaxID=169427 RepID=A0ABU1LXU4_9BURK|nr:hypothetical protein [Paraburkholderia terricola]MDR6411577.1 hypothetical protein [Paraburkholderia terricola]MDR6483740.1 hypothetical protein [Paraburkholderia terricola]
MNPDDDLDSDDLDDELDRTGEVANRSNGKTGTNTEAEPDRGKARTSSPNAQLRREKVAADEPGRRDSDPRQAGIRKGSGPARPS